MPRLRLGAWIVAGLLSAPGPAAAQNQLANPGFVSDLNGWTVLVHPNFSATHDASQGDSTPGALRVATTFSVVNLFVARQCLPVTPGQVLDFGGRYRFESGHAVNLKGYATVQWFADAACTTAGAFGPAFEVVSDVPDAWLPMHVDNVTVPAGTSSAHFIVGIGTSPGEGLGWFDDVYFGPDPLPVELLGFAVE